MFVFLVVEATEVQSYVEKNEVTISAKNEQEVFPIWMPMNAMAELVQGPKTSSNFLMSLSLRLKLEKIFRSSRLCCLHPTGLLQELWSR